MSNTMPINKISNLFKQLVPIRVDTEFRRTKFSEMSAKFRTGTVLHRNFAIAKFSFQLQICYVIPLNALN
jgi:hypothetical protein